MGVPREILNSVESMRWDGSETSQKWIVTWAQPKISGWFDGAYFLRVVTAEGEKRANPGDLIVKTPDGFDVSLAPPPEEGEE